MCECEQADQGVIAQMFDDLGGEDGSELPDPASRGSRARLRGRQSKSCSRSADHARVEIYSNRRDTGLREKAQHLTPPQPTSTTGSCPRRRST